MRIWLLMVLSALLTLFPSCSTQTTVPNAVRLHVIANSDEQVDQQVKLKVRDALLEKFGSLIAGAGSAEECFSTIDENLKIIENTAEDVLGKNGFCYGANAKCGVYDYPTRLYENAVLPAGEYRSLEVVLGNGNGKNWWCVVYPNMCIIKNEDSSNELDAVTCADLSKIDEQDVEFKSVFLEKIMHIKTPQPDEEAVKRLLESLGIR